MRLETLFFSGFLAIIVKKSYYCTTKNVREHQKLFKIPDRHFLAWYLFIYSSYHTYNYVHSDFIDSKIHLLLHQILKPLFKHADPRCFQYRYAFKHIIGWTSIKWLFYCNIQTVQRVLLLLIHSYFTSLVFKEVFEKLNKRLL